MLKTGIELKEAIDRAASVLYSIGEDISSKYNAYDDEGHEEESEEDSEKERNEGEIESSTVKDTDMLFPNGSSKKEHAFHNYIQKYLVDNLERVSGCKDMGTSKWEQFHIHTLEGRITFKINKMNQDNLKEIRIYGKAAPYGDVLTLSTVHNPTVRRSYELPLVAESSVPQQNQGDIYAVVSDKFCVSLTENWPLLPRNVQVVPYKLNVYAPGDHFAPHRDTPTKNLVGTILVSLGAEYDEPGTQKSLWEDVKGGLFVHESTKIVHWDDRYTGSTIAFHPDLPHEVAPGKGYRANLAFKVFAIDNLPEVSIGSVESRAAQAQIIKYKPHFEKLCASGQPFGLVLAHNYSLESSWVDSDAIHVAALYQVQELKIFPVPILEKVKYEILYGEPVVDFSSMVYPLTEAHLNHIVNKTEYPVMADPQLQDLFENTMIPFYQLAKKQGYNWSHDRNDFAEYTGNESQPGDVNSIYLSWALIVIPNRRL
jgi:hypothetical protein